MSLCITAVHPGTCYEPHKEVQEEENKAALGRDEWQGRESHKPMKHQQVIENFIKEGEKGRGTFVKANRDLLYSEIPIGYRPWGRWYSSNAGQSAPLAVRLKDESLLVNGARLPWPISDHQSSVLRTAETTSARFGVVPFHSIVAAFTNGEVRDWNRKPIPTGQLQKEVQIVVPSSGERWREVTETDEHGKAHTRQVHTLGDSVVSVRDRCYLSSVDETGVGAGMYCFTELHSDRAPQSLEEALNFLKPEVVMEAEARGSNVRRQGEWFAIPTKVLTSQLMSDVERGLAIYREQHVLGTDGHHRLEEAVIYKHGPRKGEVYARGVIEHTDGEHHELNLGSIRWHSIVHNIQGQSYTLKGSQAQFD